MASNRSKIEPSINAAAPHLPHPSPTASAMSPKAEVYPTPALGPEDFASSSAVPEDDSAAALTFQGILQQPDRFMAPFEIEWDPGSNEPKIDIRKVAEALRIAVGNISGAAKILAQASSSNVSRAYVHRRIKSEPLLEELMEELKETVIDVAEENIRYKVQMGDAEASKFLLKTLGKARGYVEPKKDDQEVANRDATTQEKLNAMEEGRKRAREARLKREAGTISAKIISLTANKETANG